MLSNRRALPHSAKNTEPQYVNELSVNDNEVENMPPLTRISSLMDHQDEELPPLVHIYSQTSHQEEEEMPSLIPISSNVSEVQEEDDSLDEDLDKFTIIGQEALPESCERVEKKKLCEFPNPKNSLTKPESRYENLKTPPRYTNSLVYDKLITVVAEGKVPNTNEIFLPMAGMEFQTQIAQRGQQEIKENMLAAEEYFAREFGLNFSNINWEGGIKSTKEADFFAYELNHLLDLRIYTISTVKKGLAQPRGSQKIRSGGWMARLNEDHIFGGEFGKREENKCKQYPMGTLLVFGDHVIRSFTEKQLEACETDSMGNQKKVIRTEIVPADGGDYVISFRSKKPMTATVDMLIPTSMLLESRFLKEGESAGQIQCKISDKEYDNGVIVKISETWQFPGSLVQ